MINSKRELTIQLMIKKKIIKHFNEIFINFNFKFNLLTNFYL